MILGIEHTAISSPDPERLAQWYAEHLAFRINYHSASSGTHFVKAPNGSMIEIILANETGRPSQTLRDPGIRHLAILVENFQAEYARLRSEGIQFLTEPEIKGGNSVAFFTDPDGNYLHLLERDKPLP